MSMDLHQMEYFIAVCDYGGVTPAAEALFLTPQALSKAIRKLEEELGSPLFSREKNGLSLTPFGKKALDEIRHLVSEFHLSCERLHQISAQEKGLIRLSCASRIPNALPLDELQNELTAQGITLDIMEIPDLLAEEMVQREVADLGLTVGLPQNPDLFHCTFLRRFRLCLAVNERHPLAGREVVSVRDLAGEQIVTKSPYFHSYHMIEAEAARQGIMLSYALQSPDELRFLQLVNNNNGVGIGVSFMKSNPKVRISENTILIPFEENFPWDVYLITRKGHYLSPAAQDLLNQLRSWQEPEE